MAVIVGTIIAPSSAAAQDQSNPDVLRKELADSLAQLKAAQDRKNELATENEKLKAQIAAMQKELDEIKRAQATWSDQSFFLRAQHAAWAEFLERYPRLRAEWEVFIEAGPFAVPNDLPQWADPLAVIASTPNSTPPTTAPATQPTSAASTPASTTAAPSTTSTPSTTVAPTTAAPTTAAPSTQPATKS